MIVQLNQGGSQIGTEFRHGVDHLHQIGECGGRQVVGLRHEKLLHQCKQSRNIPYFSSKMIDFNSLYHLLSIEKFSEESPQFYYFKK